MRTAAVMAGLFALAGCVSTSGAPPAWFHERQAEAEGGFPSLRDVPPTTIANTDPAYWAAVEAELHAAGEAIRNHPRAEPAPPQDADGFVETAREVLEEARAAHPD
jgi:hypothetical protein